MVGHVVALEGSPRLSDHPPYCQEGRARPGLTASFTASLTASREVLTAKLPGVTGRRGVLPGAGCVWWTFPPLGVDLLSRSSDNIR